MDLKSINIDIFWFEDAPKVCRHIQRKNLEVALCITSLTLAAQLRRNSDTTMIFYLSLSTWICTILASNMASFSLRETALSCLSHCLDYLDLQGEVACVKSIYLFNQLLKARLVIYIRKTCSSSSLPLRSRSINFAVSVAFCLRSRLHCWRHPQSRGLSLLAC